jgi:hypothetical protein
MICMVAVGTGRSGVRWYVVYIFLLLRDLHDDPLILGDDVPLIESEVSV